MGARDLAEAVEVLDLLLKFFAGHEHAGLVPSLSRS
jgi:hypothetical protein